MTPVRCQLGWLPTAKWAGLFVAEHDGSFERLGLSLQVQPGRPGLRGAGRSVLQGDAEIGLASDIADVLRIADEGGDVQVLAAVTRRTPLGLATTGTEPPSIASLVGAVIGAGTADDRTVLDALFRSHRIEPDYQFVETGRGLDELVDGRVEAMCCSTLSQVPAARRRDHVVACATFGELGLPLVGDVVVARRSWLEGHVDEAVAFLRGLAAGWAANAAAPSLGVDATLARDGAAAWLDPADVWLENQLDLLFRAECAHPGEPWLAIDADDLQLTIDALRLAGALSPAVTAAGCLDTTPLLLAQAAGPPPAAPRTGDDAP